MLRCDDFVSTARRVLLRGRRSIDRSVGRSIARAFINSSCFFTTRSSAPSRSVFFLALAISLRSVPSKRHPLSNPRHPGKYRNPHSAESLSHVESDGKEDRSIIRGLIDELREARNKKRSWGTLDGFHRIETSRSVFETKLWLKKNFDQSFDRSTWLLLAMHIHAYPVEERFHLIFIFIQ